MALSLQAGNVELNFFVGSTRIHTEEVAEGTLCTLSSIISGAGINMNTYVCRDYEFTGWKVGSPVEGTETPVTPTTVTPTDNMNLYAVFRHTDPSKVNNFVRITQLENLEANAHYLIICYYVYGGDQQYYAMTNIAGSYAYNGTNYNRLNATRLYPRAGVITAPEENLIWTLEGTPGAWKWKYDDADNTNDRWLRIGAKDQTMLVNDAASASSCAITQANGIFTIRNTANDSILKYVDDYITDEEDYFITGSYTDYVIYLYKKESPYTSYPDCNPWSVNLDALDGTIPGTSPASSTQRLTEGSVGAGVTLPTPELNDLACDGWTFVGWTIDAPVKSSNTAPEHLIPAGHYDPLYNGVTLFAVYRGTGDVTFYERITNKSQITQRTGGVDDEYIIVTYNGDQAVSTNYTSGSTWAIVDIAASGESISLEAAENAGSVVWKFNGTYFVGKDTNEPLAHNHNASRYYRVVNYGSSLFNFEINGYTSYHLWWYTDNVTHYDNDDYTKYINYRFYIYKKVTKPATVYSPYPHCAPYTIHLHACGGNIDGQQNVSIPQVSAISGITLPLATPACPDEGWEFVGWFLDEDKESFEHVEFTDFLPAGYSFIPDHEDTHLYPIYRRLTDKFKIIHGPTEIVSGDTYLITYYARETDSSPKIYDWMLTSETYDATHLKGIQGQAPQNGEGFYMIASDPRVMWVLTGSGSSWTVQNLGNDEYLTIGNNQTTTNVSAATIRILDSDDESDLSMNIGHASSDYWIYYSNLRYVTKSRSWDSTNKAYSPWCYMYRRVKEYSSWPHCEPFTVTFVPGGGKTEDDGTSKTEPSVYAGIVLPNAYANNDCSKEGWSFAGWCDMPITEETDLMTFDLYPAGTVYHPLATNTTLYAVYHQKTQHYKRITTAGRLHTGVNYIITTSANKALANLPDDPSDPSAITYAMVYPDAAHIITNDNPAIEWRLEGVRGEYEWYNSNRDVYLNLSEPGEALMDRSTAEDNFDVTYDGSSYRIRSCMSIAHSSGAKYLGTNPAGTYFTAVKDTSFSTTKTYIYRQQSNYHSFPNCTEDIDIIRWEKIDNEFNRVQVESYHCTGEPDIHGSYGTPERQEDGTYLVTFRNSVLTPCSKAIVEWGGVTSRIRIPHIVSSDANITSFMNPAEDCSDCNVYVTRGNTLTINETDSVHRLKLEEGATLNVPDGRTISVNTLVLFMEGDRDTPPEINLNSNGSIVLRNGELYHDRRIDEERYYWFSLPYDSQVKEISYSNEAANGGVPRHRGSTSELRYFVKYYNGAARAADADGGAVKNTYWTAVAPKGTDYTMKAGQGYLLGIGNQKTKTYGEQDYTHTHRVLRFTMRPGNTWLAQERNAAGSKTTNVVASTCLLEANAVHAGWNLIGNPYLHTYNTGVVPSDGKIKNGAWIMQKDAYGDPTGWYILDEARPTNVPYLTLFDPSKESGNRYSQVLAASHDLKPFEAVFVQINEGNTINFTTAMNASSGMPAYKRFLESQGPVRTGLILKGDETEDKTGFVLSEEYTKEYEIGADLVKYPNDGVLNLYSIDSLHRQLAFNGLSEADAASPIPVGVSFPAAGDYTFAFDNDWYRAEQLDTLMLIDYMTGAQTNLLYSNYTVVVNEPTAVDNRFAVLIRLAKAPHITTDIDQTSETNQPRKIIRDGQLFILRENDIFNAVGTKVR